MKHAINRIKKSSRQYLVLDVSAKKQKAKTKNKQELITKVK